MIMKAVLLAAGEGVRLLPVTANRPKHLIRIGGKPILEHCLDALKANGITEILIITHYLGDAIREYFGDGSDSGLKIEYVNQKKVLGTGNAASLSESFAGEEFLLVYGDLLFSAEAIKTVLEISDSLKPAAAMAVVPVDKPENYGIIKFKKDKAIKCIVEKPRREKAPSNLANAGIYILKKDVFNALRNVKKSDRGEWELTDAVTLLVEEGKIVLAAQISKDDWFDVGRPWDLLDANVWALKRMDHRVLGKIEEGSHLLGPVSVAETARVRSGCYIEGPCFIDEGADVGPNCYIRANTSIGKNARVGNACEVKNSIIMDGTHVGHLSYIGDSILCEKCNLGAGTLTANLRFDDGHIKMLVKNKVVDTGRRKLGVILGDNVKTGIGALLMPGVKVGGDSWVGPGLIVERDLPPKSMAFEKQNWELKVRSP
jgi:UDP-N-acetylglucosamine diphosphorylase / glucose-1-phosphate thymidylyltransferase / UDP-N-acetylgalactosamine diphosphorylase / glucosamine-1-phosphate N-acetyltransferase / galactosamine-1-phosphate N-acetyltransferase